MPLKPYDEQTERQAVELRYQRAVERLPNSLPQLQHSPLFLSVVKQLRREGWKDWHILLSIMNGVINWHLERMGANKTPETARDEGKALIHHIVNEGEGPEDPPAPAEYFTVERMQTLLDGSISSFLKAMGAVFRPRGYDPQKMRRIAATRYHYFDLDVPHDTVFPDDTMFSDAGNIDSEHKESHSTEEQE